MSASVRFSFPAPCTAWRRTCIRSSSPPPEPVPAAPASAAEAAFQVEASREAALAAAAAARSEGLDFVLKGRGFSRAVGTAKLTAALAAEGRPLARNRFFQPALFRRLIESESHEYRRPQLHTAFRGFMSPLGK